MEVFFQDQSVSSEDPIRSDKSENLVVGGLASGLEDVEGISVS